MLQNYGVRGISDVIHDLTTVICIITQDNNVIYYHGHSRLGARTVCWGAQKRLRV